MFLIFQAAGLNDGLYKLLNIIDITPCSCELARNSMPVYWGVGNSFNVSVTQCCFTSRMRLFQKQNDISLNARSINEVVLLIL